MVINADNAKSDNKSWNGNQWAGNTDTWWGVVTRGLNIKKKKKRKRKWDICYQEDELRGMVNTAGLTAQRTAISFSNVIELREWNRENQSQIW